MSDGHMVEGGIAFEGKDAFRRDYEGHRLYCEVLPAALGYLAETVPVDEFRYGELVSGEGWRPGGGDPSIEFFAAVPRTDDFDPRYHQVQVGDGSRRRPAVGVVLGRTTTLAAAVPLYGTLTLLGYQASALVRESGPCEGPWGDSTDVLLVPNSGPRYPRSADLRVSLRGDGSVPLFLMLPVPAGEPHSPEDAEGMLWQLAAAEGHPALLSRFLAARSGRPEPEGWPEARLCPRCLRVRPAWSGIMGGEPGDNSHDPCLGMLPGVAAACCGHGSESRAYVLLDDGGSLDGADALAWFAERGVGPGSPAGP